MMFTSSWRNETVNGCGNATVSDGSDSSPQAANSNDNNAPAIMHIALPHCFDSRRRCSTYDPATPPRPPLATVEMGCVYPSNDPITLASRSLPQDRSRHEGP